MESTDEMEDLFQSLPMHTFDTGIQYYQYKCCWFLKPQLLGLLAVHDQFVPLPTDVILASYPKSGSHWLKSLIFSIINRSMSKSSLLSTHLLHLIPNLEFDVYKDGKLSIPESLENSGSSRRIFHTHVPYHLLPPKVKDSGSKIIYIARDPKDVIVSMWHFVGSIKNYPPVTLEMFVDSMCTGMIISGPYFDHVLGYWKERLLEGSSSKKVFFLTFEELKRDTADHVRRLGEFLGCPFDGEGGEEEIEEIVRICSIENLSNLEVNKSEEIIPNGMLTYKSFFRKGEVGDHKNWLTPEMIERIDSVAGEKLRGSGLNLVS